MTANTITRIEVAGLRTLDDVTLELGGLTVLIGENGTGKSSLVEAMEILRRSVSGNVIQQIYQFHLGLPALLRHGVPVMRLGASTEGPDGRLDYRLAFSYDGDTPRIVGELLIATEPSGASSTLIERDPSRTTIVNDDGGKLSQVDVHPGESVLSAMGTLSLPGRMRQIKEALSSIEVHLPFDVGPGWGAKTLLHRSPLRESVQVEGAERLERHGVNLANAWHSLQNDFSVTHWKETMEYVRLGLGDDVETVVVSARLGSAPGHYSLGVKYRALEKPVPALSLSDGTLAYLAYVAMLRLPGARSLLVFDEPELHLHPDLLVRVVGLFEEIASRCPVILATHSDRLLDALRDPGSSVVVCELDRDRSTRLRRPDRDELARWLAEYGGYGSLRSAGLEPMVIAPERS